MPATVTINGDKRVIDRLEGINSFLKGPKKAFNDIGDMLVEEYKDNFPVEGRRLGPRWEKLKKATAIQKARLGYGARPILVRTGKLMMGFKKQVTNLMVRVYNPVKYFRYHQLGEGFNPKRTMIDAPERIRQDIIEILRKYLDKALNGRL